MSLEIVRDPEKKVFYLVAQHDFHLFAFKEWLEQELDAKHEVEQSRFVIADDYHELVSSHLDELNSTIQKETLQIWDKKSPRVGMHKKKKLTYDDPTAEQLVVIRKKIPLFQRYKSESPFCWCTYEGVPKICNFCRFACCSKAVQHEMSKGLITCEIHHPDSSKPLLLEADFSL
jgi:hypothetical protein